jgi:hypothetical protein
MRSCWTSRRASSWLVVGALFIAGCAYHSPHEDRGDEAASRGDWKAARDEYNSALTELAVKGVEAGSGTVKKKRDDAQVHLASAAPVTSASRGGVK